jgi:hypothetical protein
VVKSVWPQQAMTRDIFTSPQPNPGAIIDGIDYDDGIRICKRYPAPCALCSRRIEEKIVEKPLDPS